MKKTHEKEHYKNHPVMQEMLTMVVKNISYFIKCFKNKGGSTKQYCKEVGKKSRSSYSVNGDYLYAWVRTNNAFYEGNTKASFQLWLALCDYENVHLKTFMFEEIEKLDRMIGHIR